MKAMKSFNILKWTMTWSAVWSLLMAPVAYGEEAKKYSKIQMQAYLDQLGLNRQITMGEFYLKNKYLFPERIQKQIEPLFMASKNQLMPTFEVLISKATSGENVPTLQISQNKELINLQWFGEKEKLLKFQNTNLSEVDVINFNDMFTRIMASDEKYRKQVPASPVKASHGPRYPDVTRAEWKSMSAYNRANYVVNLRRLWQDAKVINELKNNQKSNTKKNSFKLIESHPYFVQLFMGQNVLAAGKSKTVVSAHRAGNYFSGKSCIVAGYVSRYEKTSSSEFCNYQVADQAYSSRDNSLYLKAKEVCQASSQIACNPYVYGTPNGAPICVTASRSNESFQKATHWDGPCDSSSRLQSSQNEIDILNDKTKTQGRYEDGNLLSEQERRNLFKSEQGAENYKLTEDYLLGILKFRGVVKTDAKSIFNSGVMSEELLAQIQLDKKAFDNEINEALKSCKAESETSKAQQVTHEKNYWQACDQLHRRFTFINELFAAKCGDQTLNPDTLKCKCSSPVAEVLPGASCSAGVPSNNPTLPASGDVTQPSQDVPAQSSEECEAQYPGAGTQAPSCLCANGSKPKNEITDGASGQESWVCSESQAAPDKPALKEECGFWCKLWKGIKTVTPFLVAGVVTYALYRVMAPKKPNLSSAQDHCPDGSLPPCGQVCAAPLKKQANGTCSCDGCPPGQTADAVTCACTTGTPSASSYLCPDATTRVTNLDNCPTYSCWNGQSYQNPMNCPAQTPAVAPNSVGR